MQSSQPVVEGSSTARLIFHKTIMLAEVIRRCLLQATSVSIGPAEIVCISEHRSKESQSFVSRCRAPAGALAPYLRRFHCFAG